jgi:endoglucanase
MRARLLRPALCCAGLALVAGSLAPLAGGAAAGAATARDSGTQTTGVSVTTTAATIAQGRVLSPNTRFFVRPPDQGAIQQGIQLLRSGDRKDAALIAKMEATPQAVWLTGGTPAQVTRQVRTTLLEAALEHAVPVFVAYDIPGRDCAQYSAGGALTQADYEAWIAAVAAALGKTQAVVWLEPDSLGLLPSTCGATNYPFTDTERYAELNYAVTALEQQPNVSVYLDGTHSAWLGVGQISQELVQAGVQQAQGFFLDASNYQPDPQLIDYGTWISDCIAFANDPEEGGWRLGNYGYCASQYYPATPSDFSTWDLSTQWYAANMGTAVATTHFMIDTSRNGQGPNSMSPYAAAPYDQPASVVSSLASGNWCNPPGAGLGLTPTANTGVPLLDANLWVKTPGESDGQCDSAGGARAWDYTDYTQPGWPTTSADQALFDPLWGLNDPAAGAWFPQQAIQLAQDANPPLLGS